MRILLDRGSSTKPRDANIGQYNFIIAINIVICRDIYWLIKAYYSNYITPSRSDLVSRAQPLDSLLEHLKLI